MTWRLMLTDPAGEPRPFILPAFMFGGTNHANAEEATEAWIALFDDAHRGALRRYEEGGPMEAGTVMFTDFTLRGTWMAAMDSGAFHDFTFTPGVSMIVSCRDQEEIDRYWSGLSAAPQAERCGWCVDRWGVSWQVVPTTLPSSWPTPPPARRSCTWARSTWPTCRPPSSPRRSRRRTSASGTYFSPKPLRADLSGLGENAVLVGKVRSRPAPPAPDNRLRTTILSRAV